MIITLSLEKYVCMTETAKRRIPCLDIISKPSALSERPGPVSNVSDYN